MIIVKLVNDIEVNEQQTTDVLVLVFYSKTPYQFTLLLKIFTLLSTAPQYKSRTLYHLKIIAQVEILAVNVIDEVNDVAVEEFLDVVFM